MAILASVELAAATRAEVYRVPAGQAREVAIQIADLAGDPEFTGSADLALLTPADRVFEQVSITNAGSGYTVMPTVKLITKADRAPAFALTMKVTGVEIVNAGLGYTPGDTVTVGSGGALAVDTVDAVGRVTAVSIGTAGDFPTLPAGIVKSTGGTGKDLMVRLTFGLQSITATDQGEGYHEDPVLVVEGNGNGAAVEMTAPYMVRPRNYLLKNTPMPAGGYVSLSKIKLESGYIVVARSQMAAALTITI